MGKIDTGENKLCFACGKKNEWGLKLSFKNLNGKAITEFTPDFHYQGYKETVHGGIISTILDESMVYAALFKGKEVVTAKLSVRFKNPMLLKGKYRIEAEVINIKRNIVNTRARIFDRDRNIIAEGEGVFWTVKDIDK